MFSFYIQVWSRVKHTLSFLKCEDNPKPNLKSIIIGNIDWNPLSKTELMKLYFGMAKVVQLPTQNILASFILFIDNFRATGRGKLKKFSIVAQQCFLLFRHHFTTLVAAVYGWEWEWLEICWSRLVITTRTTRKSN